MPGIRGILLASIAACGLAATPLLATGSRSDEGARLFDARRLAEARSVLEEAVREDARDARAASYLGRVLLADGEADRSVEWLEKSVALEESNAEYHLWLGRAYGARAIRASVLKQPALARKVKKEFERASQLDPDNLEARFGLIEYYLRAPAIMGGSRKKADEQAQEIRRRNALQGYRAFGRIAEHEKDFDKALSEYARAADEFAGQAEPSYWIGALHARKKEYAACYEIGSVAALSGQNLERGEECLKLYLQHDPLPDEPTPASAHYRLGLLYEKKGSRDLARREYSAALELEPFFPEAREALKKIS
jgi:tetratricopeptide (TPR) repeat protein